MKKLLILLVFLFESIVLAGNWTNYPLVTTPSLSDTFLIGTTVTNNLITSSNLATWVSTNLSSPVAIAGSNTNVIITATGGGSITLSNGVTGATLRVPPTGPVTALNGFDVATNTGNIIIQGDVTVSNTIIAVASYILTNTAPAHTLWIGESQFYTNDVVVLTGVDRILSACYNYGVLHVFNSGATVTNITPPAAWHILGTWNVTNGGSTIVSVYVGPGPTGQVETNAICFPQK